MTSKQDRSLDVWIGENIFMLPDIGYYGPTKKHGGHQDNVRCKSTEEALDLYKKYSSEAYDMAYCLCFWKAGWGPLVLPEFSSSIFDSEQIVRRMVQAGLSFDCWTVHDVSNRSWEWSVAFGKSIHTPQFYNTGEKQWTAKDKDKNKAICLAAKAACEGLGLEFRKSLATIVEAGENKSLEED